jgi:hypothetical protein
MCHMLCHVMSRYAMSCHVVLNHTLSCHVTNSRDLHVHSWHQDSETSRKQTTSDWNQWYGILFLPLHLTQVSLIRVLDEFCTAPSELWLYSDCPIEDRRQLLQAVSAMVECQSMYVESMHQSRPVP